MEIIDNELGVSITRPHTKLEKTINGQQVYAIKFTEGDYTDIIFSYGRVNFEEDNENDTLKIHFDYEVHQAYQEYDKELFEKELGDFLVELLQEGVQKNSIVYTGGTQDNETRNNNHSESD